MNVLRDGAWRHVLDIDEEANWDRGGVRSRARARVASSDVLGTNDFDIFGA